MLMEYSKAALVFDLIDCLFEATKYSKVYLFTIYTV